MATLRRRNNNGKFKSDAEATPFYDALSMPSLMVPGVAVKADQSIVVNVRWSISGVNCA